MNATISRIPKELHLFMLLLLNDFRYGKELGDEL